MNCKITLFRIYYIFLIYNLYKKKYFEFNKDNES